MFEWIDQYAAVIIALCALLFTAYQVIAQRKHNKLSVKPHITSFTKDNREPGAAHLQVVLMNNGLGPAFINKFQVYISGEPCETKEVEDAVKKLLGVPYVKATVTTLGDDYAMPAGQAMNLLSVSFPRKSDEEVDAAAQRLNNLDLELCYSSGYGEKFIFDSRKYG